MTFPSCAPNGLSKRFRAHVAIDSSFKGYSICLVFLKLFEKVYAPLIAGLLALFRGDRALAEEKRCELDRQFQCVSNDLD